MHLNVIGKKTPTLIADILRKISDLALRLMDDGFVDSIDQSIANYNSYLKERVRQN